MEARTARFQGDRSADTDVAVAGVVKEDEGGASVVADSKSAEVGGVTGKSGADRLNGWEQVFMVGVKKPRL